MYNFDHSERLHQHFEIGSKESVSFLPPLPFLSLVRGEVALFARPPREVDDLDQFRSWPDSFRWIHPVVERLRTLVEVEGNPVVVVQKLSPLYVYPSHVGEPYLANVAMKG